MRTKALLCAAAMAAGAFSTMAQSNVYSLNVVGYVNYGFPVSGNYYLVSNPLNGTTNDLNTILPNASNGTGVALWDANLQDFSAVAPTYFTSTHTWSPNPSIAAGQGFFVIPNNPFTNTFIGEVRQNPVTLSLIGNGNYECIGSIVPLQGGLTNQLGNYPANNGDAVAVWDANVQDFSAVAPTYFTAGAHWAPDWLFNAADGFFIIRNGGPVTWTRTFTVQ